MDHCSVSLTPEQAAAVNGLMRETEAFGIDLAPDDYRSLRAVTFHAAPEDFEDAECRVRFWSVSVAGTIREQAPDTETRVAA